MTNLTALSNIAHSTVTHMTLKEITDLLEVEHNKAMAKVTKMAEEPEFGTVAKTSTVYNDKGNGALGITQTYLSN